MLILDLDVSSAKRICKQSKTDTSLSVDLHIAGIEQGR